MSGILTQLKSVAEVLNELEVSWALVGALAVSVHTEPRTTRDIDVAVLVENEAEQEALLALLEKKGFGKPSVLMHLMPTHQLGFRMQVPVSTGSSVALDLLFSSSGIEREVIEGATSTEIFPGLFIPIASVGHLIAMKILSQSDTTRLNDQVDIQKLVAMASANDIETARKAANLIQERGFNRGVSLKTELEQALNKFRTGSHH